MSETSIALDLPRRSMTRRRTYVIFGLERGGTSAVAGAARALGLWMGDDLPGNNEDPDFHAKKLGDLRRAIKQRNAEHDVWGWKYPNIGVQLPPILKNLRNPYFILVHRDPVATALSRHKWDGPGLRRRIDVAIHEASAMSSLNTSFALASRRPCLLISHERASTRPDALMDELADFLGVEHPTEPLRSKIHDYLEPGSYKSFEEFFGTPTPNPAFGAQRSPETSGAGAAPAAGARPGAAKPAPAPAATPPAQPAHTAPTQAPQAIPATPPGAVPAATPQQGVNGGDAPPAQVDNETAPAGASAAVGTTAPDLRGG